MVRFHLRREAWAISFTPLCTFCAAKSVREESWCHVCVTSIGEDNVDSNIETNDVSSVQSLQKMFSILQTQMVTRRLSGVMPSDNVTGEDAITLYRVNLLQLSVRGGY